MAAVLLEKQVSYIFNSDPASGAQAIGDDGNQFQVSLDNPLSVPSSAVSCSIGLLQASVWNTSPNIASDFKNNDFTFTTAVAPAGTYSLTIPEGLYSVEGLNSYLASQFVNLGLPTNLMSISGDSATQKSIITILTSGDSIDLTVATSVRTVLGFNSQVLTAPSANYSFFSDSTAAFNRVNSYVIASDLVTQGIPVNSQSQGIVGLVPINVAPGSQISYSPQNVAWFDGGGLIGNPKINFNFRLLDQDLRNVIALDFWSFTVSIRWSILLATGTLSMRP